MRDFEGSPQHFTAMGRERNTKSYSVWSTKRQKIQKERYNEVIENMNEQNDHVEAIKGGLASLDKIFNKNNIEYRVLGSVLVAAINGKPHRTLGDIDVLIDEGDQDRIFFSLKSEGYTIERKKKYGFRWVEVHHPRNLGFTFLLIGTFRDNYFHCKLTDNIELNISSRYLEPTDYQLFGTHFTGIPIRSIYEGLKISSFNPKRSLDRKVVEKHLGGNIPNGENLDEAFTVFLSGVKLPHAYVLFSQLYNIYGGLRVLLGKKYEIWD